MAAPAAQNVAQNPAFIDIALVPDQQVPGAAQANQIHVVAQQLDLDGLTYRIPLSNGTFYEIPLNDAQKQQLAAACQRMGLNLNEAFTIDLKEFVCTQNNVSHDFNDADPGFSDLIDVLRPVSAHELPRYPQGARASSLAKPETRLSARLKARTSADRDGLTLAALKKHDLETDLPLTVDKKMEIVKREKAAEHLLAASKRLVEDLNNAPRPQNLESQGRTAGFQKTLELFNEQGVPGGQKPLNQSAIFFEAANPLNLANVAPPQKADALKRKEARSKEFVDGCEVPKKSGKFSIGREDVDAPEEAEYHKQRALGGIETKADFRNGCRAIQAKVAKDSPEQFFTQLASAITSSDDQATIMGRVDAILNGNPFQLVFNQLHAVDQTALRVALHDRCEALVQHVFKANSLNGTPAQGADAAIPLGNKAPARIPGHMRTWGHIASQPAEVFIRAAQAEIDHLITAIPQPQPPP